MLSLYMFRAYMPGDGRTMPARSLISAETISRADGQPQFHWLRTALNMAAMASGTWPPTPEPGPTGWTCFPRAAARTYVADARAVPDARDFAITTMQRWDRTQRCEDMALVVSELVTNALHHAVPRLGQCPHRRPIRVGLLQPGSCVLCVIADPSPHPPRLQDPDLFAESGRGLHIVGALSDNWGYTLLGDLGKSVWATFANPTVLQDLAQGL